MGRRRLYPATRSVAERVMGAVVFRARADLRARWRAWAALGLLVGVMGGAVTAAAAGARRTDSAYGRFLESTRAPDVLAYGSTQGDLFAGITADQYARIPQVAQVVTAREFAVFDPPDASISASLDPGLGTVMARYKMLAGRPPRPDRVDEAMVSFTMADQHHLHVGDTLRLSVSSAEGVQPAVVPVVFRVVGIEASAGEFPPQVGTGTNQVSTTPAFYRAAAGTLRSFDVVLLRLRRGVRDVRAFEGEVQRLAAGKPTNLFTLGDQSVNTQHSIHLQAVSLWLLAGLLGMAGVLVVGQLLARQGHLDSGEHPDLAALGMTRSQLWGIGMARAVVVGAAAAAVAAAVALALSPLTPVGLARTAEPHPGPSADWLALGLGALATVVAVILAGAWPAWRAATRSGRPSATTGQARPSVVAEALARASAPVPLTTGVRLALEPGRGRSAVPVRSTLTGAVIGVVALAGALSFSASLQHLLATPRLYGATYDARIGSTEFPNDAGDAALPAVGDDPDVVDASAGFAGFPVLMGGVRGDGIAVSTVRGASLMPTPIEGRLPAAPGEVMLGASTMEAVHAHVGSTVRAIVADATPEPVPLRVVGRAVFPSLSDAMGLGKGVAMTPDGLRAMIPQGAPPPDTVLVRFRKGTDPARARAELQRRLGSDSSFQVLAPERPTDLVNFGRVQSLPVVLGGLLGAFAVATLAHLLVTSIRRRRRDLAILKTLGLSSGHVRATVAWQSTTLAVVAVVVGVPLGVVAGRWVWLAFAANLGIVGETVLPSLTLAALGLATVTVANVVAVLPGRIAARTSPAAVLRSE